MKQSLGFSTPSTSKARGASPLSASHTLVFTLLFAAAVYLLIALALPAAAAEKGVEDLLPAQCAPGWSMEGKPATYTPQTLYKYIDGEAEMYLPYGFEKAATVRYSRIGGKGYGVVASIFRMGSLLDAFGIYASYRGPGVEPAAVGVEGFGDESQLMFYQDRYFVRIEVSGASKGDAAVFRSCAAAISKSLPAGRERPKELALIKVPGVVPLTDRYYPSGLLGYGFFGGGLTAESMLGAERVKIFVMLFPSAEAAVRGLEEYAAYLKTSKGGSQAPAGKDESLLHATDPLYKGMALSRSGRFVVGAAGLKDAASGDALVGALKERLPKE